MDEILSVKKADGASHRYIKDLKSRLNQFAASFDGKQVASITTTEIDQSLRGLTGGSESYSPFLGTRMLMLPAEFVNKHASMRNSYRGLCRCAASRMPLPSCSI